MLHFHLTLYRRGATQNEIHVPIPHGQSKRRYISRTNFKDT